MSIHIFQLTRAAETMKRGTSTANFPSTVVGHTSSLSLSTPQQPSKSTSNVSVAEEEDYTEVEEVVQPTDDEYLNLYSDRTVSLFQSTLSPLLAVADKYLEEGKGSHTKAKPKTANVKGKKKKLPMSADGEQKEAEEETVVMDLRHTIHYDMNGSAEQIVNDLSDSLFGPEPPEVMCTVGTFTDISDRENHYHSFRRLCQRPLYLHSRL